MELLSEEGRISSQKKAKNLAQPKRGEGETLWSEEKKRRASLYDYYSEGTRRGNSREELLF